jgi:hypothetical protein
MTLINNNMKNSASESKKETIKSTSWIFTPRDAEAKLISFTNGPISLAKID